MKKVKRSGKGIKVNDLHKVLKKSYNDPKSDYNNWALDKNLSDHHIQVYHDSVTNNVYHINRGTKSTDKNGKSSLSDYKTDGLYALGHKDQRFNDASKSLQDTRNKYKSSKIIVAGHSLGSATARHAVSQLKDPSNTQLITFNGAYNPLIDKKLKNETMIASQHDPVSFTTPGMNDTIIKSKNNNNPFDIKKIME